MRYWILLLLSLFAIACVSAQSITPVDIHYFNNGAYNGAIKIYQSDKMESFFENYTGICKKRNGFWGYRVRIFADVGPNARRQANETKVKFSNAYPKTKAYVVYNEPNFEVHCGNFRTRLEAMGLLNSIKTAYPGAFVVYGIVEFPDF